MVVAPVHLLDASDGEFAYLIGWTMRIPTEVNDTCIGVTWSTEDFGKRKMVFGHWLNQRDIAIRLLLPLHSVFCGLKVVITKR